MASKSSLGYFVYKASKSSVIAGAQVIKDELLKKNSLVAKGNYLGINSIRAIDKHFSPKKFSLSTKDVSTYLASSSLIHSINGWTYLSRAIDSYIGGNEDVAIHLSYYAELRAAMSLLASEGIGVFNSKHIALYEDGSIIPAPKHKVWVWDKTAKKKKKKDANSGTHQFTWNVLEKWADSSIKPDSSILEIFTVKGISFDEYLKALPIPAPYTAGSKTIKEWLLDWGFDINRFRDDRDSRNEVSYRPQKLGNFDATIDICEVVQKIKRFWDIIAPSTSNDNFYLLDAYLLKKLFKKIIPGALDFKQTVEDAFTFHGAYDSTLIKLICEEFPFNDEHLIFKEAQKKEITALPLIARATLMLRVATGLSSQIFKQGGLMKSDLNFVWDSYGLDNGFWDFGNRPTDFRNLWSNIETHLNDVEDWANKNAGSSVLNFNSANIDKLAYYSQFSRASLWGISLH